MVPDSGDVSAHRDRADQMTDDTFDAIAAKLAEHERALSEMYQQFARTFVEDADLWTGLSRDETRHAAWVEHMRHLVDVRAIEAPESPARRPAIDMAIQYASTLADRCRRGDMTRLQAHALARDVENGMLERKLFTALGGAAREFKDLQDALVLETTSHRDRIVQSLARLMA